MNERLTISIPIVPGETKTESVKRAVHAFQDNILQEAKCLVIRSEIEDAARIIQSVYGKSGTPRFTKLEELSEVLGRLKACI